MISISFTLALIAIVYGARLLATSKKENLGGLYKYLAWFVIVAGFLMILCDTGRGVMRMCHRGQARMENKEMMMMGRGCDDGMMGGDCRMMMMHHNMCYGNGCGGMMHCGGMMNCNDGGNCPMNSDGSCSGMMNCKDGGMKDCKDGGMGSCKDGNGSMGASCPMMGNMKDKKDSAKAKK